MPTYQWDTAIAATVFPGFVTNILATGCTAHTIATAPPLANSAATIPNAFYKALIKPTPTYASACTASKKLKISGLNTGTAVFSDFLSLAKPTAYTTPMNVQGGTVHVANGSSATKARMWVQAYSAGGKVVQQAGGTTHLMPLGSSATGVSLTMLPAANVTVPVGGFLVLKIAVNGAGSAVRWYGGGGIAPIGALKWATVETPGAGGGGGNVVENRERFHISDGTPYPDGTKVYEYDASTMAYTGTYGVIGAATGAGVAQGTSSLFVAGTSGLTGVAVAATSTKEALSNGAYTFAIVANVANFDLTLTSPNAVPQVYPSVNVTGTGLVCDDTGLVFDIAGVPAVGAGSFSVTGAGSITDGAVAVAAAGVGEVVFTRSTGDLQEYFYVIPDPAAGHTWIANKAELLNHRVNPAAVAKLYAKVTTAGTAGLTEPAWPTTVNSTVVDGSITWTMVEVETLVTNAVKGYQLGEWTPGVIASVGSAGVTTSSPTRIAPAGVGQYALCSSVPGTGGKTTAFGAGTTGATGITVDATSPAAALSNGDYTFTSNAAGDLVVTDVIGGVAQTYLAAAVAAGLMTKTNTGLIFNLTGTLVLGVGGTFTVSGAAPIVTAVSTLGGFVAGTTGVTGLTVDATNVVGGANAGSYTFTSNAVGDVTFIKGAGAAQIVLAAALAAPFTLTDGALTLALTGTPVLGTGGSFQIGTAGGGSAGAVVPVWPTPIVNGVTTFADGNVVWTMFNDEVYV